MYKAFEHEPRFFLLLLLSEEEEEEEEEKEEEDVFETILSRSFVPEC